MIKNQLNFIPASYKTQPEFYIKRFEHVAAAFKHPNGRNILLEVDADIWNYRNPSDAYGKLRIEYQGKTCVHCIGVSYATLKEAMVEVDRLMSLPNYGNKFDEKPVLTNELDYARYQNKVLVKAQELLHKEHLKAFPYRKPAVPFELTEEDKKILLDIGYLEKDFEWIEEAANLSIYELDGERSVSWKEACDALGRKTFLSGIGRSTFHWDSGRDGVDASGRKHSVCFNSGPDSPYRKNNS